MRPRSQDPRARMFRRLDRPRCDSRQYVSINTGPIPMAKGNRTNLRKFARLFPMTWSGAFCGIIALAILTQFREINCVAMPTRFALILSRGGFIVLWSPQGARRPIVPAGLSITVPSAPVEWLPSLHHSVLGWIEIGFPM